MKRRLLLCFSLVGFYASFGQSFVNPSLETWGVTNTCEVNIAPDNWPNYSNGGIGPDEANFTLCPTTIPTRASNGIVYARCFAGTPTLGEGMYQNVTGFVSGNSYIISFDYAGSNLYGGIADAKWHLFIDDVDVNQTPLFNSLDTTWRTHSFTFTSTNTVHKIGVRLYMVTTGGNGSGAIDNFSFSGGVIPVSSFISSDTSFCNEGGKCLSFFDHSTGNPTSWHWLFPGATPDSSTLQNPVNICYYTPGTYPVTLIVTNGADSDTLTVSPMITFGQAPVAPVITRSNDTLTVTGGGFTFQWYYNGSPIAGATDSFYVVTSVGTYAVRVTDGVGCSSISNGIVADVDQFKVQSSKFWVYPNPASDYLVIARNGATKQYLSVEISNVLGEQILVSNLQHLTSSLSIDVSSLDKGLYLIQLTDGERVFRSKFVKE